MLENLLKKVMRLRTGLVICPHVLFHRSLSIKRISSHLTIMLQCFNKRYSHINILDHIGFTKIIKKWQLIPGSRVYNYVRPVCCIAYNKDNIKEIK